MIQSNSESDCAVLKDGASLGAPWGAKLAPVEKLNDLGASRIARKTAGGGLVPCCVRKGKQVSVGRHPCSSEKLTSGPSKPRRYAPMWSRKFGQLARWRSSLRCSTRMLSIRWRAAMTVLSSFTWWFLCLLRDLRPASSESRLIHSLGSRTNHNEFLRIHKNSYEFL